MSNPTVSIIIPVYNTESYLPRCLDSLLVQTYADFEIICVDDGSTDNSGQICDEYARKDSRIRVVHIPNGGVSNARNTGLELVRGEYIMFVDSDDWVEPEHVELLLPLAGEDLVYCGYNSVVHGNWVTAFSFGNRVLLREQWIDCFAAFWKEYTTWSLWRGCYSTEIIRKNHLLLDSNMTVGEDEEFNLRYFCQCGSVRFVEACTYNYETGDHGSALHRYHPNRASDCAKICQAIEAISKRGEYASRWYYWHSALAHYEKWEKNIQTDRQEEVRVQLQKCYESPYFRKCIPYIRKHGTLDEKIETYFMSAWAHPLYKPFYSIIAALSRLKNAVLKRK